MAEAARRRKYDPYRSSGVTYDGSAVRILEGDEVRQPRPQVRPRKKRAVRPKIKVREAGAVSPFAVCGFAAVMVIAVLILMGYVQLTTLSNEVVKLNEQIEELSSEEASLRASYELAYDLGAIEAAVTNDGSMSRPLPGQMVYVDLTAPDSVVRYEPKPEKKSFLEAVCEIVDNVVSYF